MSNTLCRCSVCGRTNDLELVDKIGDYTSGPFYPDEGSKYPWDMICHDCSEDINDQLEGFEEDDTSA